METKRRRWTTDRLTDDAIPTTASNEMMMLMSIVVRQTRFLSVNESVSPPKDLHLHNARPTRHSPDFPPHFARETDPRKREPRVRVVSAISTFYKKKRRQTTMMRFSTRPALLGWVLAICLAWTPTVTGATSSASSVRRNDKAKDHNNNDDDDDDEALSCPCPKLLPRPDLLQKELLARWMVHTLDWGVLTTISSRLTDSTGAAMPFGNVYSFVDGPCNSNATNTWTAAGTPYFYGTYKDQSLKDMEANPAASLTLTEASVAAVCGAEALPSCRMQSVDSGDPENPVCARLTLSGRLVEVFGATSGAELERAQAALFERHTQMQYWPANHNWVIFKLVIDDIWFIDYFGGASILNVEEYHAAPLAGLAEKEESN
jgi:hypothetical protein